MGINDIGFERGRVVRHHNLLATLGVPNITGPINKGKGKGNTAGKGHGKGNGASVNYRIAGNDVRIAGSDTRII